MNDQILIKSINKALEKSLLPEKPLLGRLERLDKFVKYAVAYISDKENLFFSSYFSRISFIINKYGISGRDSYLIHTFRKLFPIKSEFSEKHFELGKYVLHQLIFKCLGVKLNIDVRNIDFSDFLKKDEPAEYESFRSYLKVYFKCIAADNKSFIVLDDQDREIIVDFSEPETNSELAGMIKQFEKWNSLPVKASLFDVRISSDRCQASHFVLEPDFLVDVTSVSEAFDAFGISVAGYGLRKLVDKKSSIALHVGNIANVILDELVFDPQLTFDYFLQKIFKINPLAFASFSNDDVRSLIEIVKDHYQNIKKVIKDDFKNQGIRAQNSYVEPSFYAPRIGIQGRFDLLHQDGNEMHIVELKSGKSYRPNAYGLNNCHYHQTLLYDLILASNLGKSVKRNNFILYSAESDKPLRYAPTIKSEQREAIKVRNRIYMEECKMQHSNSADPFIKKFISRFQDKLSGFKNQDIQGLVKIYGDLDTIEKAFWEQCFSFLSREYALSKIGDELSEKNKGLSSVWQLDIEVKKERFLLIDKLKIKEDRSMQDDPVIHFAYSESSVTLSNFRLGDIVILYPTSALKDERMRTQIFKCTLTDLHADHLTVRLRSRQMNSSIFGEYKYWNIEHDILDSSFSRTFRQLYHFAKAEVSHRHKILGIRPSDQFVNQTFEKQPFTTKSQHEILEQAVSAQDYFLIWGPPGTGKTSVVLKDIISHYQKNTSTRLLIMAYTNRAVDEICAAIENISENNDYIRIGSKYSCGSDFKAKLLNAKLESVQSRRELRSVLVDHQIYVGTLASILGKPELFELLDFGVCLVDEASQILEPSLVGILSRVKKFVLIGDHLQLPAIVLQRENQAAVKDEVLRKAGFRSFAESLFERLYRQAVQYKWNWAYSQLQQQGRMHKTIMNFVNTHFYSGSLDVLEGIERLDSAREWTSDSKLGKILSEERMIFIPSGSDEESKNLKVNRHEAEIVSQLITWFQILFDSNLQRIDEQTIGIITPFRAQIALINAELGKADISYDDLTVDTVERYQGGARDIIIISTVVDSPFQLDSIVSENQEGMDRKLNVAISRAREQVIIVGNPEIIRDARYYRHFIDESYNLQWVH